MAVTSQRDPIRFLFALPGFHQEERGAEISLLAVADELARGGDVVTVIGAGPARTGTAYEYRQALAINRRHFERMPRLPALRSETAWEDATFALALSGAYRPSNYDITVTCNFPFTHWVLRHGGKDRPRHLFVTQNGNWPAISNRAEFRYFACDGLVCTNPDFEAETRDRWRTALIPNGIHLDQFQGVDGDPEGFGLPGGSRIVLMVSALIDTKRVMDGMRAVAAIPDAHFVVAGDGPLRDEVENLAKTILPGRFTRLMLAAEQMPALYRSADCFLHMSLKESFGNVYVEAMAAGLPIVAPSNPRVQWIVGASDTLCDAEDLSAVTAALTRALARGRGEADPRFCQFTWPAIAQQYRDFAQALIASKPRHGGVSQALPPRLGR
jgi:glycosyltransferase involved in cell wall biosynthesis